MTSIYVIADLIDKDIIFRRYANQNNRWTANFENAEIKEGGTLVSAYGNGDSAFAALDAYVKEIAGKVLIFNAFSVDQRVIFTMPKDLSALK